MGHSLKIRLVRYYSCYHHHRRHHQYHHYHYQYHYHGDSQGQSLSHQLQRQKMSNLYFKKDLSSLLLCSFLTGKACTLHPAPQNGALACFTAGQYSPVCAVMCKSGFDFVFNPSPLYYCYNGEWMFFLFPGIPSTPQVPWPDCSGKIFNHLKHKNFNVFSLYSFCELCCILASLKDKSKYTLKSIMRDLLSFF